MILAIALIILAPATIFGNVFCLLVIHKDVQGISDIARIFMQSLTIADLFTGIFVITPTIGAAFTDTWPYSYTYCEISAFTVTLFNSCSVLSLMFVNVERYIAIEWPLHYTTILTPFRARVSVVVLWIFGFGWASLHVFRPGQIARYHQGIFMCVADPVNVHTPDITSIVWAMLFFGFPCLLTVCMFLRLCSISRKHARQIDANESVLRQVENNAVNKFRRNEFKTTITFFILTLILIITYIPASVIMTLDSLDVSLTQWMWETSILLMLSNSSVNIVVYSIRNKYFRLRAKQLLGVAAIENGNGATSRATAGIRSHRLGPGALP
ncbi:probable G-protein coupled receptor 21 [Amphiura filiformis]|uniref:probable G-protein coupled receptor 21 n=1 Tax=Amphiura filiformis TaxID=82378 RepID=UPI003B21DB06